MSTWPTDRPLSTQVRRHAAQWARSQYQLVVLAAEFADSDEWALDGSPTPAHWLAAIADVETCTAREWIRIGRCLRVLPMTADAFATRELSYSKVRTLTRLATRANEAELVAIASSAPANDLTRALAVWMGNTMAPEELEDHHHSQRSIRWRTEPDGMTTFTLRFPPLIAAILIAALTKIVMRSEPGREADGSWPSLAQQHADALDQLLTKSVEMITEIVLHVRGDGCTLDDGTPIPETVVERIAPDAFLRALIHDAETNPVDASNRRRHPTDRQKRVVKERDRACVDCGRHGLLQYDHHPDYDVTRRTITTELELRCAPCHQRRHAAASAPTQNHPARPGNPLRGSPTLR